MEVIVQHYNLLVICEYVVKVTQLTAQRRRPALSLSVDAPGGRDRRVRPLRTAFKPSHAQSLSSLRVPPSLMRARLAARLYSPPSSSLPCSRLCSPIRCSMAERAARFGMAAVVAPPQRE